MEGSGSVRGGEGGGGEESRADDATIVGTPNTLTHVCYRCAWGNSMADLPSANRRSDTPFAFLCRTTGLCNKLVVLVDQSENLSGKQVFQTD